MQTLRWYVVPLLLLFFGMQRPHPKMMPTRTTTAGMCSALFVGLVWGAALMSPAYAQSFATFTVDKVKAAGKAPVDLEKIAKDGTKTKLEKIIDVAATDKPSDVAKKIQEAFGDDVKVNDTNPAKVEFKVTGTGLAVSFSGAQNNAIGYTIDIEYRVAFVLPPNQPLGEFALLPNPINGLDMLPTDATITAGFAHGISPVSFNAPADTGLDQLANMLNATLIAGGYLTSMPDPTDVIVAAQGVGLPVEVDFSIESLGSVGPDGGIETQLFAFNVPEPASLALLGAGLAGISLVRRKQS